MGALIKDTELVEVLHSKRLSRQDVLLTILCVEHSKPKDVTAIKKLGRNAGFTEIQKWNVSSILGRAKGFAIRLPGGWSATSGGREYIQQLGLLPAKKSRKVLHVAASLRQETQRIADPETMSFVEESIACFETGLFRSAVVLSWVGAMSLLQDQIIKHNLSTFNAEAQKKHADWKNAKLKDDLSRLKESEFLDIIGSPPISLVGKNVKEELKNNCLQLRNACGHPNSLSIGENRVAAHLEVLIMNVFKKFK